MIDQGSTGSSAATGLRLRFLDGLRGWAALVVVIFHATHELFGQYVPAVNTTRLGLLNDGKLAIYVFFVLSGTVLSLPYLRTLDAREITKLAIRRYVRLTVPIATASFLALIMLEEGWFYNRQASIIVGSKDWLDTFYAFPPEFWGWVRFSAYDVFFHYQAAASYSFVLWTMTWEFAGSFLIFGLLAICGNSVAARLFAYLVAVVICRWEAPILLGFVCGCLIAEAMLAPIPLRLPAWSRDLAGTALIGAAFMGSVFLRQSYSPQHCTWLAVMIVAGVVMSARWRRLLEVPISRWLGRISFPLYLLHPLVICGPASLLIINMSQRGWSGAVLVELVAIFVIAASVLAATLFEPVEQIAIRASHGFSAFLLGADARRSRLDAPAQVPRPQP